MNIPAFNILCLMALSINQVAPYSGYWDSWNSDPVYEQPNYNTWDNPFDQYGDYNYYFWRPTSSGGGGDDWERKRSLEDPLEDALAATGE